MQRFLITGGSGFIGTNVVDALLRDGRYHVLSLDVVAPRKAAHRPYWQQADLLDRDALHAAIAAFRPHYVLHLAARTDLRGKSIDDYAANTTGMANLLDALDGVAELKQAVFTSSMLVCRAGYMPQNDHDYAPSTLYGESKVRTEEIIRAHRPRYLWSIVRPTSIWGPWFGEPYANFFKMVLSHTYIDLGRHACRKTYGYIDNAVYQTMAIFQAPAADVAEKVFYLGDYEPYNISEWAREIGAAAHIRIPRAPFWLFRCAALVGDLLTACRLRFPMTSFRLKNMTTDNIIDMAATQRIAPDLPVSREEGNRRTLAWLAGQT